MMCLSVCVFVYVVHVSVYLCTYVCTYVCTYTYTSCYCLEHSNFFGVDETFGPIAISLRRERMDDDTPPVTMAAGSTGTLQSKYLYRIIVRTCQVSVWSSTYV